MTNSLSSRPNQLLSEAPQTGAVQDTIIPRALNAFIDNARSMNAQGNQVERAVWLQAAPEEHMGRVAAQGDTRPMAASKEAMEDLRRILNGRAAFYSKADLSVDTSGKSLSQSFQALRAVARQSMGVA